MSNVEFIRPVSVEEGLRNSRASRTKAIHDVIQSGDLSLKCLPTFLKDALAIEAWKERPSPLGRSISNETFIEWIESPFPRGVGATKDIVLRLLGDDIEARNLFDAAIKGQHGGVHNPNRDAVTGRMASKPLNVDNINVEDHRKTVRPTGTSADQGLRRIRKEADAGNGAAKAQLADVLSEKTSVNKACVVLGFRKKTITIRDEPETIAEAAIKRSGAFLTAQQAWGHMTSDERREFLAWTSLDAGVAQ
jgi:hypothetical protein